MKSAASLTAIAATLLLAACGGANARVSDAAGAVPGAIARGPAGDYPMVLGAPFIVDGVTYTPADTLNYDSVGYAHVDDGEGVSGAHRTLPLPSYIEVTSLETGRTVLVRLTERGPMNGSDLVSLSPGAWSQLGLPRGSRVAVRVRRVNPPEPERALLRSGGQAPARMDTPPGLLAALKRKLGAPAAATSPVMSAPTVAIAAPVRLAPKPLPAPVPIAKPAAKPAESPPAKSSTETPGLFVQAGAYSSKTRAEAVAQGIAGTVTQAGRVWRVRVGPHKDRGQADAALAKVRAAGYADARVVTAP